jgi:Flp pilus assembly protein TadD
LDGAIIHLEKSVQCNANLVLAHNDLGSALVKKGKLREALTHYEKALAIYPDNPVALGNLAWLLSTSADESLRDGDRALKLAQSAIRFSPGNQPGLVHVLAAALAENGRFAEADETAERALSLALAQGDSSLAELIRIARRHYQAGEPLRDHTFAPDHASPVEP